MKASKKLQELQAEIDRLSVENKKLHILNTFTAYADEYICSPYTLVLHLDNYPAGKVSYDFDRDRTWIYEYLSSHIDSPMCIYVAKDEEAAKKHDYTMIWRDGAWTSGADMLSKSAKKE